MIYTELKGAQFGVKGDKALIKTPAVKAQIFGAERNTAHYFFCFSTDH